MLSEELLAIMICPACKTRVRLVSDSWLVCQNPDCAFKYPIRDGIPQMLKEEGAKHAHLKINALKPNV